MSTNETETSALRVGVVGLGIMGGAFAGHLAAAGIHTLGYDIVQANMDALKAQGVQSRPSVRAVAAEADVVITSLPHTKALEEALLGDAGLALVARPGLLVIETSTLPLEAKAALRARLAPAGTGMLDAPVSGTGAQAKTKDITVLASGERADFERVLGVLAHFSRSVRYVGDFGAGSKVKYIANLLVTVHILAAAEAIVLGEKAGLELGVLVDVLTHSAATSRMLEVRGPSMAAGTYAPPMMKVDVFQKDLDIISSFARQCGCPVPLFSTCVPFFTAAGAQHMGGYDTAAVVSVLRQMAGLSKLL
jgi:3-hydroxyisobutyrate dehydrogenase-like beta-hydroxyacid dehydrogenase